MRYPSLSLNGLRRMAFTLVELLVVIAIIAILAAILLPVMGKMKRSGLVTKSTNNLRQIQLANIQYASEHNMNFVPGKTKSDVDGSGNVTKDGEIWMLNDDLHRYMGLDRSKYSYKKFADVFYSPLVDRNIVSFSYGYNVTKLELYDPLSDKRTRNSLRVDPISRTLAFAESQDWQIRSHEASKYDGTEKYSALTIAYRIGGSGGSAKTLAVFYDGHVESLSRDQVVGNNTLWGTSYQ